MQVWANLCFKNKKKEELCFPWAGWYKWQCCLVLSPSPSQGLPQHQVHLLLLGLCTLHCTAFDFTSGVIILNTGVCGRGTACMFCWQAEEWDVWVGAKAQPAVSWVIPMGVTNPLGSRGPYTSHLTTHERVHCVAGFRVEMRECWAGGGCPCSGSSTGTVRTCLPFLLLPRALCEPLIYSFTSVVAEFLVDPRSRSWNLQSSCPDGSAAHSGSSSAFYVWLS